MKFAHLALLSTLIVTYAPASQASSPDAADFEAAVSLRENWKTLTRDIVFPADWQPDNETFIYRKTVAGGFTWFSESVSGGKPVKAFDHDIIARGLSAAMGSDVLPSDLPLSHVNLDNDNDTLHFSMDYENWQCSLSRADCHAQEYDHYRPKAFGVVRDLTVSLDDMVPASPDGKYRAMQEGYNLVIKNSNDDIVYQTSDGSAENQYDIASVKWSGENDALVVIRFVPGEARYVTRVVAAPENRLQPEVVKQLYPKPGDRVDADQPVLINLTTSSQQDVARSLTDQAYIISGIYWHNDNRAFSFHYTRRGHQQERIITVDKQSGRATVAIEENAETFINRWRGFYHDVNKAGKERIWLSERDGYAHLYLYDGDNDSQPQQITQGNWPVREVVHVDDEARQIYFAASGMNEGEDPYFMHYYRINFDGTALTPLTGAKANHEVRFSDDMQWYVDVYSRPDLPNVAELRRTKDGKLLRTLAKTDISRLTAAGFTAPDVFVAKGRDDKTDIWGLIVKPQNFDATKQYPVIENIYAGPHDSFVPKSFWPFGYHSGGDKIIGMQALANLGFIVVQMDGMGTANRSKAFHDVAWKNLGDSGFPDRIKWHKAAAAQYLWYDISKGAGIYGASAGGQSTLGALVFHPEFYTTGVAYAGCYDNRMDKISWNELWMGYPVDQSYVASSAMEHAGDLQGNLLIINGEQDSNVDPASTMQVVDKLVKAGKDFDLLIIPGGEHSAGRSTGPVNYVQRRQFSFFVEKLQHSPLPDFNQESGK